MKILSHKTSPMNKELRFSAVYPKSFLNTTIGAVLKYTVIAAVVGAVTYFTVGAGAMSAVSALLAQATPGMLSLFWAIGTLDVIGIGTWI